MKTYPTLGILFFAIVLPLAWSQEPQIESDYPFSKDSLRHKGLPQGTLTHHVWKNSQVFPGTIRRYYVYVPVQYDASKPAALMVFQDGHTFIRENGDYRAPAVFDNLIHSKEIPITICVFIDPGHLTPELPPELGWRPRPANRSFEYDTLSADYSNFLLKEILPEVEKSYNITNDQNGRAISGNSSGGICAFTVAWERPDQFRKVLSHIGSFTNIRGGHNYPALIRKGGEPKPLRVLLQDGSGDLDNQHGNWPLANKQMYAALKFRDYDVKFVYGTGGHNGNHGGAIFPNSLRWLWREYSLRSN